MYGTQGITDIVWCTAWFGPNGHAVSFCDGVKALGRVNCRQPFKKGTEWQA
jgi:hypothetical protein